MKLFIWALSENCIITDTATRDAVHAKRDNPAIPRIGATSGSVFTLTETTLSVSLLTLTNQDHRKTSKWLKSVFERSVSWNRYIIKTYTQNSINELINHLIDSKFKKANKLFVLAFENHADRT